MRELTFTVAAREALAEEMERDPAVFVMGEGIGERGGNWATTTGLYERLARGGCATPRSSSAASPASAPGAALVGGRPVVDFMFLDFLLDAHGRDHQPDGEVPVHERGAAEDADCPARHHRRGARLGHPPLRQLLSDAGPRAGPAGGGAHHARRRQGPAQDGDPLRRSGLLPGAQVAAGRQRAGAGRGLH